MITDLVVMAYCLHCYFLLESAVGFRLDMLSISKMTKYSITDLLNPQKMVKEKVDSLNEKSSSRDPEKFVVVFNKVFIPLKNDFKELLNFKEGFCD